MTVDFSTESGFREAHKDLPQWLCVYLACAYADSVLQGGKGRRVIDSARDWLRGLAPEGECRTAADAIIANSIDSTDVVHNGHYAAYFVAHFARGEAYHICQHWFASSDGSRPPNEQFYLRVMTALADFDLSDPEVQGPALDLLDELGL